MVAELPLQARDRRRGRAEYANTFMSNAVEPMRDLGRPLVHLLLVFAAHEHIHEACEGRIVHPATKAKLLIGEVGVIVLRGELDGVVIGVVGLQNDFAVSLPRPERPETCVSS